VLACYGDAEKYTSQLRALEKYIANNPTSAPARFLLGYQYLLTGHRDEAQKQLAEALKLTPKDKLAEYVLKQLQTGQPITPPPASPPPVPALALPPAPSPDPSSKPAAEAPKEPQPAKSTSPKEL
jgi:tetratricopeptide (TPR) repeat protein